MVKTWELKGALIRDFGTQIEASHILEIRENRLSYIVKGHVAPNQKERQILELHFGKPFIKRVLPIENKGRKTNGKP